MKVYDKEMYNKQESIRTIVVIIIVFLLGFVSGYFARNINETQQQQENTYNTYIVKNK